MREREREREGRTKQREKERTFPKRAEISDRSRPGRSHQPAAHAARRGAEGPLAGRPSSAGDPGPADPGPADPPTRRARPGTRRELEPTPRRSPTRPSRVTSRSHLLRIKEGGVSLARSRFPANEWRVSVGPSRRRRCVGRGSIADDAFGHSQFESSSFSGVFRLANLVFPKTFFLSLVDRMGEIERPKKPGKRYAQVKAEI